tara:strand:+ start:485 stop:886 length:402 start_codon:yes stop_codon:yes gene_type:complete
MVKITYKGETRNIPARYLPSSLSGADRKKQIKSIFEGTKRPSLKSYTSKRSSWVKKFEQKYNHKINDFSFIHKNLMKPEGVRQIMDKGRAAYFTSGSRPETTPEAWALGRLASTLLGGPARKVDKKIYNKYKI